MKAINVPSSGTLKALIVRRILRISSHKRLGTILWLISVASELTTSFSSLHNTLAQVTNELDLTDLVLAQSY